MFPLRRPTTEEVCVEYSVRHTRIEVLASPCSRAFADFCSQYGIVHTLSTPNHPQANGEVERLNRSICETLAKLASSDQRDRDEYLGTVQFAHNTAHHTSISDIPCLKELPRTLLDVPAAVVVPTFPSDSVSPSSYADAAADVLPHLHEHAGQNSRSSFLRGTSTSIQ